MERPLLVYTTFPDMDTGLAIGEQFVQEGLIACANVIPGMRSVYSWKGKVERGEEAVGILKTRTGLQQAVGQALRARHPYETPIVLFIEPQDADRETLAWILAETAQEEA